MTSGYTRASEAARLDAGHDKKMPKLFFFIIVLAAAAGVTGCKKQPLESSTQGGGASSAGQQTETLKQVDKPASYDGPFGLAAKISVADLKKMGFKEVETHPGLFEGKPPKPLSEPGDYLVVATPDAGVCRIRASFDIDNVNGSGDQLKAKVDRFAETMRMKYGKHSEKINYISQDVYKRNPEYWMMGLKEESVVYAYDWTAGKTEQPLPAGLSNVEIVATALSLSKGYAAINYTFDNKDQCMDEIDKAKAANL